MRELKRLQRSSEQHPGVQTFVQSQCCRLMVLLLSLPPLEMLPALKIKHTTGIAGYAISRTYLETLVDLPWNKFAARPPTSTSASAPEAQHGGASGGQGQAQQHQAQQGDHDSDVHAGSTALEPAESSGAPDDTTSAAPEPKGGLERLAAVVPHHRCKTHE